LPGGIGPAEPVTTGVGPDDGGSVIVDSTGLDLLGVADFEGDLDGPAAGLRVVAAGAGVRDGTARASRMRVTGAPCLGKTSSTGWALVRLATGSGVGLGRATTASSSSSRSGSGRTALELTGPPARLTLTSPPYTMQRAPKPYATFRSMRRRRPVESTNTGEGCATTITSVSGVSTSAIGGFWGSCNVTSRA
jgi:hypothetical protein